MWALRACLLVAVAAAAGLNSTFPLSPDGTHIFSGNAERITISELSCAKEDTCTVVLSVHGGSMTMGLEKTGAETWHLVAGSTSVTIKSGFSTALDVTINGEAVTVDAGDGQKKVELKGDATDDGVELYGKNAGDTARCVAAPLRGAAATPALPSSYTAKILSVTGRSVLPNPVNNATTYLAYYVDAPNGWRIDRADAPGGAPDQSEIVLYDKGLKYFAYYGDAPACTCDVIPEAERAFEPPLAVPPSAAPAGDGAWTWRVRIGVDGQGPCYDASTATFAADGNLTTYRDRTECDEQVIDEHQTWLSVKNGTPDPAALEPPAFCDSAC